MLIRSFKINHTKLKPGIFVHSVQQFGKTFITTFDLRFKMPNRGIYLSNSALHSLEHLIATFYSTSYPADKIYFGPMGCQTGFYLVVYGRKNLAWLEATLPKLNQYINNQVEVPGKNITSCGNFRSLSISTAKAVWNAWYQARNTWQKQYKK